MLFGNGVAEWALRSRSLQHLPKNETFDSVVALRVEGVSISAISRVEGIAWNTVFATPAHLEYPSTGTEPDSPLREKFQGGLEPG